MNALKTHWLDSEIRKVALETHGSGDIQHRYNIALKMILASQGGISHGMLRLQPIHEIAEPKVKPDPIFDPSIKDTQRKTESVTDKGGNP